MHDNHESPASASLDFRVSERSVIFLFGHIGD